MDALARACRNGDDVDPALLDGLDLETPDDAGLYAVEHAFSFMSRAVGPLMEFEQTLLQRLPAKAVCLHTLIVRDPDAFYSITDRLDFDRRVFKMTMVDWAAYSCSAAALRAYENRIGFAHLQVLIESPHESDSDGVDVLIDALPNRYDPRYAIMARLAFLQPRLKSNVVECILTKIAHYPDLVTYVVMPLVALVVRSTWYLNNEHATLLRTMIGLLIESVRPNHVFEADIETPLQLKPLGLPERFDMEHVYDRMWTGNREFEWRGFLMKFLPEELVLRYPTPPSRQQSLPSPRCRTCGLTLEEHTRLYQPHLLIKTWGDFVPSYALSSPNDLQVVFSDGPVAFPELNATWHAPLVKAESGEVKGKGGGGGGGGGGGEKFDGATNV